MVYYGDKKKIKGDKIFGYIHKSWYHKTVIFNKGISFYDTCNKVKKELELNNLNDDIKNIAQKVHTAKKVSLKKDI